MVGFRLVRDAQAVRVPGCDGGGGAYGGVLADTCQDDSWAVSVLLTGSRPEKGGDIPAPDRLPLNGWNATPRCGRCQYQSQAGGLVGRRRIADRTKGAASAIRPAIALFFCRRSLTVRGCVLFLRGSGHRTVRVPAQQRLRRNRTRPGGERG